MAYQQFKAMDIFKIIRRWHGGYSVCGISKALGVDRKTVRKYIDLGLEAGFSREKPLPDKDECLKRVEAFIPTRRRPQPARASLLPYKDEIFRLITAVADPLKPKTAYEVIRERHGLEVGYSSFKRFVREHIQTRLEPKQSTCRFETDPGEEIQIDYGKAGRLFDPLTGRNRDIYAFVATLSHSRLKFVEFVYKQDQRNFIGSHLRMFEYFGGVAKRLVIDNLKAGVIRPDLYQPELNRAYQEMAEHYGCFIDPARPRHPKDKGKVERAVPVVREQFRKLKALDPKIDVASANRRIRRWCLQENGMAIHGTTSLLPFEAFTVLEKDALAALPLDHFEIPTWKKAKVHVDQFIQFEKSFYSLPSQHVGKTVWVKATERLVKIFEDHVLIKTHVRVKGGRKTDNKDFPKNARIMLESKQIQALLARGKNVGEDFEQLLHDVLRQHAMLNYRRALALLRLAEKYDKELLNRTAKIARVRKIHAPKQVQILLEKLDRQHDEQTIPLSGQTREMIRDAHYFTNPS